MFHAGRDMGALSADQLLENERTNCAPAAALAAAPRVARWRQHALPGCMYGTPRPMAVTARFARRLRRHALTGWWRCHASPGTPRRLPAARHAPCPGPCGSGVARATPQRRHVLHGGSLRGTTLCPAGSARLVWRRWHVSLGERGVAVRGVRSAATWPSEPGLPSKACHCRSAALGLPFALPGNACSCRRTRLCRLARRGAAPLSVQASRRHRARRGAAAGLRHCRTRGAV